LIKVLKRFGEPDEMARRQRFSARAVVSPSPIAAVLFFTEFPYRHWTKRTVVSGFL